MSCASFWGTAGASRLSEIFCFGEHELDEARFELRRRGQRVEVQPKVLRLLCLLVAERHRAISDAELLATLWPAETVSHASIKRAIMGARTVLGQRGQDCIRTIRGHGYQFVLPVQEVERRTPSSRPETLRAEPFAPSSRDAIFVGREGVLAELDAGLASALAGRGRCVLLIGEPGIGKTRLLHELASRAIAHGANAWFGRCMEFDGAPAFWPLMQIVREAVRGRGHDELRAWLGPGAPELAEAFPELKQRLPDLPSAPALDSSPARFRLFDSMACFLARAAEQRPLVLLLDDLQRADQSSLRLLVFLTRQLQSERVLIVGTTRAADHRDHGVSELLAALARESATRSVELEGLCREDIARYLELRSGATAAPAVVARLHEQTAGNPLFLEELVRDLGSSGAHAVSAHPLGVSGAIERHLESLSVACRELLTVAAVLGRELSVGLLTQLAGDAPDAVMLGLSEAIAAGVVQPSATGAGQHRFTHALMRDVLYARIPPLERAQQHARVGLALEARGASRDDAQLAEIAEHFMHAAPSHDGGRALVYARRAAERAMQRLAYEEAATYLGRALEVLELGPPDTRQRMELLLDRGEALALGTEPDVARAVLLEAAALARELGANDVLARAASLLAGPRESGTVDAQRIGVLREALRALPESDSRTPGLQALLAKSLSYTSEHAERERIALSALSLTVKLSSPALRAEGLLACHQALTHPEHLGQRVFITDQLTQLAHLHGDARIMMFAATTRFQNCVERGDVADMDAAINTLEALGRQVRDPVVRWYATTFRSTRAMIAGQIDLAEQLAREALQHGKLVGEDLAFHQYCIQVIGLYRMQGRMAEAEGLARDVSLRYPALAGWRAVVACIDADVGRETLARETLAQLTDRDLSTLRRDPYLLSALCPIANLCSRVGNAAIARPLYEALLPYEHLHGNVSFGGATYGPISLALAQLAMCMSELHAAGLHCEHAIRAAQRMPSPFFLMQGLMTHAFVLKAGRNAETREQAADLARRAQVIADASGLFAVAARCESLARSLKAKAPRPNAPS